MAKEDDIQARMVKLAVALVKICDELPESSAAGHIASQLLRSGTSPAPNYAEARGAESDKDFVHPPPPKSGRVFVALSAPLRQDSRPARGGTRLVRPDCVGTDGEPGRLCTHQDSNPVAPRVSETKSKRTL